VRHYNLRRATARQVQEFKTVDIDEWFLAERQEGATEGFYTALHEDFYRAYLDSGAVFYPHRVCPMGDIASVVGEHIHPYLTYLPGLADLLGWSGAYVPSWVREFYATLWIQLDHEYSQFTVRGDPRRLYRAMILERLRLTESTTRLHSRCYDMIDPPRHAHGGLLPDTAEVAACFSPPFRDGSRCTPS